MASSDIQQRAAELGRVIHSHNHNYYVLQEPLISDDEFDALLKELCRLEAQYPELVRTDSPTQRVGGKASDKFQKVWHPAPILSLGNAYGVDEAQAWFERMTRLDDRVEKTGWVVEPKIDGLTVVLHYEDGMFVQGATRGDGEIGEDITSNLRTIRSLPLRIPAAATNISHPRHIVVRGEAYIPKQEFVTWNQRLATSGERTYVNPRNAASGALRQLDPNMTARCPLALLCYHVVETDGKILATQWGVLEYLRSMGFGVADISQRFNNLGDALAYCQSWADERFTLNYEVDGMVIKIDDLLIQNSLGVVGKDPRGALAFKFPSVEVTTNLIQIGVNVGRTGVLTPYAVLEPVKVGGVTVKQATLHNFGYIFDKDIRIGDRVLIKRAGEVIPYVIGPVLDRRTGRERRPDLPTSCPVCGKPIRQSEHEAAIYCMNSVCPAQLRRNLEHFVSRGALEIDGFGEKLASRFVELGLVEDVADIFSLTKEELSDLDGFGERKAHALVEAIHKARTCQLDRLIVALGIRGVGAVVASDLASRFKSLDALRKAKCDELETASGIGPNISQAIVDWFSKRNNQSVLRKLRQAGCWPQQGTSINPSSGRLAGKTFVITGTLKNWSRSQATAFIEKNGGRVTTSLSKKTNYLVVGDNPGSKQKKAQDLSIPEINEFALRTLGPD